MQRKIVTTITIVALLAFGVVLFRSVYYTFSDEILLPTAILASASSSLDNSLSSPKRISIPKIKVDAKIVSVGITRKGNMAAPSNFKDVGWYKYGALPGIKGSAVLAGHVNNGIALPAVFSKLKDLREGDDIFITTKENKILHFRVTESRIYDFDAEASEVFTEDTGKLLKLITCTGNWISKYKTHDKRLVTSARLVEV